MSAGDAAARGWGPGWPNCQPGQMQTLVRPDGLRIPVRHEILPLVAYLMDATEKRGYDIRPNATWGFACRPIRGTQVPSNHSWGLAIDINSDVNPMLYGAPGWAALTASHRTDMPAWMPPLWEAHMFRWGGDYSKRQDAMHYEFMGSPADAARIIAEIAAGTAPLDGGNALPLTLKTGTPQDPYLTGDFVISSRQRLNAWIARHKPHGLNPLPLTGGYDKAMALYVVAFQEWVIAIQKAYKLIQWPAPTTTVDVRVYGGLGYWATH